MFDESGVGMEKEILELVSRNTKKKGFFYPNLLLLPKCLITQWVKEVQGTAPHIVVEVWKEDTEVVNIAHQDPNLVVLVISSYQVILNK